MTTTETGVQATNAARGISQLPDFQQPQHSVALQATCPAGQQGAGSVSCQAFPAGPYPRHTTPPPHHAPATPRPCHTTPPPYHAPATPRRLRHRTCGPVGPRRRRRRGCPSGRSGPRDGGAPVSPVAAMAAGKGRGAARRDADTIRTRSGVSRSCPTRSTPTPPRASWTEKDVARVFCPGGPARAGASGTQRTAMARQRRGHATAAPSSGACLRVRCCRRRLPWFRAASVPPHRASLTRGLGDRAMPPRRQPPRLPLTRREARAGAERPARMQAVDGSTSRLDSAARTRRRLPARRIT